MNAAFYSSVLLNCFLSIIFNINSAQIVPECAANITVIVNFDSIDNATFLLKELNNETLQFTNAKDVENFLNRDDEQSSLNPLCYKNVTKDANVTECEISIDSREELAAVWNRRISRSNKITVRILSNRCSVSVATHSHPLMHVAMFVIIGLLLLVVIVAVAHYVWKKNKNPPRKRSSLGGSEREKFGPPYYKRVQQPKPVSPPIYRQSRPLSVQVADIPPDASYETPCGRPRAATEEAYLKPSGERRGQTAELASRSVDSENRNQATEYDIPTSLPVYETVVTSYDVE